MLALTLVIVVLWSPVANAFQPQYDHRAVALTLPTHVKSFGLKALTELCPAATGTIQHVLDGKWVVQDLLEIGAINLDAGPILCYVTEGIELESGIARGTVRLSQSSVPPITMRGLHEVLAVPNLLTPLAHYYEVLVSYEHTGLSGVYVALLDTGSARSSFPFAASRFGVQGGAVERIHGPLGVQKVVSGAVNVKLLRKAFPAGIDAQTGAQLYTYEELCEFMLERLDNANPVVVARLDGDVPRIGLNLMDAWGVQAHPQRGIFKYIDCDCASLYYEY